MTAFAPTLSACFAYRTAVCELSAPTLIITSPRFDPRRQALEVRLSLSSEDNLSTSETIAMTIP